METNPEKDSGVLGSLFQTVINDMRGSTPIWEDFTYKSMKLHSSLKTTVTTIGAFLEAFQKVADMATSSKGATREIGSALTRLCLRHRSIESQLKVLTNSIVDNLVAPLQEKLEDWKKAVAQLDKDHAKEYKKAKQDIKKAASDTIRLQKKVKKGSTHGKSEMQHKLDAAMIDVNSKYHQLEETEKNSLRSALIEERSRFCLFITCLQPFVENELKLLTEMSHIQEIMQSLGMQASNPSSLPESSEQVISDLKGVDSATFNFSQHQHSPPSSPSSLGSRKSSMCSINSINSSSSGSSKSHSPSHTMHKRNPSQPPPGAIRLTSVSSQDSGFTSQDTLFLRPNTPQSLSLYQTSANSAAEKEVEGDCDSTPTTPSDNTPSASSTWNNWPNLPGATVRSMQDQARPHTISSAYEKGHARPALKPGMFEPPQEGVEMRPKPVRSLSHHAQQQQQQHRPSATISKLQPVLPPHCPKPKVKAVAPPMVPAGGGQPIYANMAELGAKGGYQCDISPDDGEPTTPTTAASNALAQMQQDTSLELAKAIRELEASTAALTSAYDTPAYNTPQQQDNEANNTSYAPAPTQPPPICGPPPPGPPASTAAVAYDTESYTSKTSLQCSSGYGTMNSTPASSEDTIASGGVADSIPEQVELDEDQCCVEGEDCDSLGQAEAEKYSTIPRSGEASAAYRAAAAQVAMQQPRRPASTAGLPVSSTAAFNQGGGLQGVARRGSVNIPGQKPPPPVRRTSSVTGAAPAHVHKLRNSPPRQVSVDSAMLAQQQQLQQHQQQHQQFYQQSYSVDQGGGGEPLYAEINKPRSSSTSGAYSHRGYDSTAAPPGMYQTNNDGSYLPLQQEDNGSTAAGQFNMMHQHNSGGGVISQHTPSAMNVIQNLNAKFASLNSQYEDGGGGSMSDPSSYSSNPSSSVVVQGPVVKPPPPAVMQKPNKSGIPLPPSVVAAQKQQQQQQQRQQHHNRGGGGSNQHHQRALQNSHQRQLQQHLQHGHMIDNHRRSQHHHHNQHAAAGNNNHHHQQQAPQQQQQQHHHSHHPVSAAPEDFPLPPTEEELQEIERIYSVPPSLANKSSSSQQPPATVQKQSHNHQHHHPHQQHQQQYHHNQRQLQQQQQQHPSGGASPQASLLLELKRRVSVDDSSEA